MKVLLTSDWHLGKYLFGKNLLEEQAKFFTGPFLSLLKEIKPDLLIMAGDIFDRPIPDLESLQLFEEIVKKIYETQTTALFILGNHDSQRVAIHSDLLRLAKIFLVCNLNYYFEELVFQGKKGEKLNFYAVPYLSLREYEESLENLKFKIQSLLFPIISGVYEGTAEFLQSLLSQTASFIKKPALLVSHLAISSFLHSEEECPLKGLSKDFTLPKEIFAPFDLVLLGHLHQPQIHDGKFIYPGAPLPYSFEKADSPRGLTLLETKGGKLLHLEQLTVTPPYQLRTYEDYFESLKNLPRDEAYVKIVLRDERPIYEVERELRRTFPNLLSLTYAMEELGSNIEQNLRVNLEVSEDESPVVLEPKKLFKEFYKFIMEKDPPEEIERAFNRYYQKFSEEGENYGN